MKYRSIRNLGIDFIEGKLYHMVTHRRDNRRDNLHVLLSEHNVTRLMTDDILMEYFKPIRKFKYGK